MNPLEAKLNRLLLRRLDAKKIVFVLLCFALTFWLTGCNSNTPPMPPIEIVEIPPTPSLQLTPSPTPAPSAMPYPSHQISLIYNSVYPLAFVYEGKGWQVEAKDERDESGYWQVRLIVGEYEYVVDFKGACYTISLVDVNGHDAISFDTGKSYGIGQGFPATYVFDIVEKKWIEPPSWDPSFNVVYNDGSSLKVEGLPPEGYDSSYDWHGTDYPGWEMGRDFWHTGTSHFEDSKLRVDFDYPAIGIGGYFLYEYTGEEYKLIKAGIGNKLKADGSKEPPKYDFTNQD